jgi:hypothetical protein
MEEWLLDLIYQSVDSLLLKGDFKSCDVILQRVTTDIENIPVVFLMAFASITRVAESRLECRKDFLNKLRERLQDSPDLIELLPYLA